MLFTTLLIAIMTHYYKIPQSNHSNYAKFAQVLHTGVGHNHHCLQRNKHHSGPCFVTTSIGNLCIFANDSDYGLTCYLTTTNSAFVTQIVNHPNGDMDLTTAHNIHKFNDIPVGRFLSINGAFNNII